MRKTRTALQADDRLLHESSFSLSFCLTVLVYQPVRLAALEKQYPDDRAGTHLPHHPWITESVTAMYPASMYRSH